MFKSIIGITMYSIFLVYIGGIGHENDIHKECALTGKSVNTSWVNKPIKCEVIK